MLHVFTEIKGFYHFIAFFIKWAPNSNQYKYTYDDESEISEPCRFNTEFVCIWVNREHIIGQLKFLKS